MSMFLCAGMRLPKFYTRRTKRIAVVTLVCALMGLIAKDMFFSKPQPRPYHPKRIVTKALSTHKAEKKHKKELSNDVTLVTAYINIKFGAKMKKDMLRKMYRRNMTYFRRIRNPVVAFIDNKEDADYFKAQRESLPKHLTKVVLIDRDDLWPFRLLQRIKNVLQKLSPASKAHPYVRNPLYVALLHSKVDFLRRAVYENYFKTQYFSWVDISYFQNFLKVNGDPVKLAMPSALKRDRVLFGEVRKFNKSLSPRYIFKHNPSWLSSGYFSAHIDTMMRWERDYKRCVMNFLTQGLTGTDQMVIYAMFVPGGCKLSPSRLQIYRPLAGSTDKWHAIGIQAWQDWQKLRGVYPIKGNELGTDKKSIKTTGLKKSKESKKSAGLKKSREYKKSVRLQKAIESKKSVGPKKSIESKMPEGLKKSMKSKASVGLKKAIKYKTFVKSKKSLNGKRLVKPLKQAKMQQQKMKTGTKLRVKPINKTTKKAKSQPRGPPILKSRV